MAFLLLHNYTDFIKNIEDSMELLGISLVKEI